MGRIKQMIKQAVLNLIDDSGPYPRGQADYNGKTTDFALLVPYGLISNPPVDSHVLLFSSQGQESVKFGLVSDFDNKDNPSITGETGLRNAITQAFILLNKNGGIDISSINIELGSLTTQALVNALFITAIYNNHTHNDPVSGVTGVPNQLGVAGTHTTTETKAS